MSNGQSDVKMRRCWLQSLLIGISSDCFQTRVGIYLKCHCFIVASSSSFSSYGDDAISKMPWDGSVQLTAELFYNKEDAEVDYDDDMLVMMKRNVEVQWGR